jgi:hypothetical protein
MKKFHGLTSYEDKLNYLMYLDFYELLAIIQHHEVLLKLNQLYHPCLLKLSNMYNQEQYKYVTLPNRLKVIENALEYRKSETIKYLNQL